MTEGLKGQVKWYSEKKGYGFVISDEGEEFFVHRSGVADFGYFGLQKNDPVTFDIKETYKGKQAVNVRPLKSS